MLELALLLEHFGIECGHFLEQETKLKAARMHIYVRRGGPNYQKGLAKMRMLGEEIGIPIEVDVLFTEILETFAYDDNCDDQFNMVGLIPGRELSSISGRGLACGWVL